MHPLILLMKSVTIRLINQASYHIQERDSNERDKRFSRTA